MTAPRGEEWDWPPPRRSRAAQIEARIVEERIVVPAGRAVPRRQTGRTGRIADGFGAFVFLLFKIVFAVGLSGVVLACLTLIGAIFRV